jgi:cytochrome c biogenesis protein CcmG, thiol:disulfide interchange protein DsbE
MRLGPRGVRLLLAAVALAAAAAALVTLAALDDDPARTAAPPPAPSSAAAAGPTAGERAPRFAGRALDGARVDLARLRGTPVVVNFFASWCQPCKREAATIRRVARAYVDRVAVVAIAVDDTDAGGRRFARRYRWTWPILPDRGRRFATAYGVPGTPTTVVIDRRGTIAGAILGEATTAKLSRLIDRTLA